MDSARIAFKLRAQILQFSGELSRGFPKVLARFVAEMIYGIQARQSVRLTEVSRALAEPIPIKKTVERLSRQLRNPRLARWLTNRLLMRAAERVRDMTLLILDLSDVHKKYAQRMEHLATVWDGSEKIKESGLLDAEHHRGGNGFGPDPASLWPALLPYGARLPERKHRAAGGHREGLGEDPEARDLGHGSRRRPRLSLSLSIT